MTAANIAGDGVPGNADTTDQDFALVVSNAALSVGARCCRPTRGRSRPAATATARSSPARTSPSRQPLANAGTSGVTGGRRHARRVAVGRRDRRHARPGRTSLPGPDGEQRRRACRRRSTRARRVARRSTMSSRSRPPQGVRRHDAGHGARRAPTARRSRCTSTDVPKAIPDNNAAGVSSTLAVATPGIVRDVNVRIGQRHAHVRRRPDLPAHLAGRHDACCSPTASAAAATTSRTPSSTTRPPRRSAPRGAVHRHLQAEQRPAVALRRRAGAGHLDAADPRSRGGRRRHARRLGAHAPPRRRAPSSRRRRTPRLLRRRRPRRRRRRARRRRPRPSPPPAPVPPPAPAPPPPPPPAAGSLDLSLIARTIRTDAKGFFRLTFRAPARGRARSSSRPSPRRRPSPVSASASCASPARPSRCPRTAGCGCA